MRYLKRATYAALRLLVELVVMLAAVAMVADHWGDKVRHRRAGDDAGNEAAHR